MKKLLFFIPTLSGGGAEKVLVNLVNNMDKSKYEITVLSLFNIGINKSFLNSEIKYEYIFNEIFRGNKYFFKLFSPKRLFKYMIRKEYDIIISYLQGPTTRIVSGCNIENTKLVNWVHNEIHDITKLSSSYRSKSETIRSYEKFNSTIFVADTAKQAFQKLLPNLSVDLKVLYNTVETDEILKKSKEPIEDLYLSQGTFNMISVGRFAPQKAFERLLRIVGKLVYEDQIPVHLYLLGKGELEERYKEIISDLNISSNVTLLGYKENPYKYVASSDLFVCSSLYEGFSTAVTESLIVGTPVITTLCSGMEELLGSNNEYGIVVQNDEEILYQELKSLLKDREEINRLKINVKKRGEYFNTSSTVQAVENYFDSI